MYRKITSPPGVADPPILPRLAAEYLYAPHCGFTLTASGGAQSCLTIPVRRGVTKR